MLMKVLRPALPVLPGRHSRGRRRHAELSHLPALRQVVAKPDWEEWWAKYPCTRMHGAAFADEFYPQDAEPPGF